MWASRGNLSDPTSIRTGQPRRSAWLVCIAASAILTLGSGTVSSPQTDPPLPRDPGPEVLLRMEIVGGLAGTELLLDRVPIFTLLGDGTVVYQPAGEVEPRLRTTDLSLEAVDELLTLALDDSGLDAARATSDVPPNADATSIRFTFRVDGVQRRVTISARDVELPGSWETAQLASLAATLADFDAYLPPDSDARPYEARAYRAVFNEADPESAELMPWPWTDLAPGDLRADPDAPAIRTAILRPDQAARLLELPSAGATGIALQAPGGDAYLVSLRPLLPDEMWLADDAADAEDRIGA